MNTEVATVAEKPPAGTSPLVVIKGQIDQREVEFKNALPAHIPVERFKRVLMTAIQNNPDLVKADRASLFNSAMRAAQDGLLPDGREGAIVIYTTKVKDPDTRREVWINKAQWMPMIGGIRKKVRNSGTLQDWNAHVVFAHDEFEYELGDEPFIRHRPAKGDRGKAVAAYSVATFKDGTKSREVMSLAEIEKVRAVSRAKDKGPWVQWWEEMARKTVARRHSKVLPMSTDLDDLIRRDDSLYDLAGARDESKQEGRRPKLVEALDRIAGQASDSKPSREAVESEPVPAGEEMRVDGETGEILEGGTTDEPAVEDSPERTKLLGDLRIIAAQDGVKKLRLKLGGLTADEQKLVTETDREELFKAAGRGKVE